MKDKEVLADAIKDTHPRESFEKAVGRAVRKHKGEYQDYLRIMGDVRELAYTRGISVVEAAKEIVGQP